MLLYFIFLLLVLVLSSNTQEELSYRKVKSQLDTVTANWVNYPNIYRGENQSILFHKGIHSYTLKNDSR